MFNPGPSYGDSRGPCSLAPGPQPCGCCRGSQCRAKVSVRGFREKPTEQGPGSPSQGHPEVLSHPGSPFSHRMGLFGLPSESSAPREFPWTVGLAVILPSLLFFSAASICLVRKLHGGKEVENEEKEIACKELETDHVEKEKERQIKGKRVGGQVTVPQGRSCGS